MSFKYLKGQPLEVKLEGAGIITLPAPTVSDFDLLNTIIRNINTPIPEFEVKRNAAVAMLADRLVERGQDAKEKPVTPEQMTVIENYRIAFYFNFGIQLDLYLAALFPQPKKEEKEAPESESPLAKNK